MYKKGVALCVILLLSLTLVAAQNQFETSEPYSIKKDPGGNIIHAEYTVIGPPGKGNIFIKPSTQITKILCEGKDSTGTNQKGIYTFQTTMTTQKQIKSCTLDYKNQKQQTLLFHLEPTQALNEDNIHIQTWKQSKSHGDIDEMIKPYQGEGLGILKEKEVTVKPSFTQRGITKMINKACGKIKESPANPTRNFHVALEGGDPEIAKELAIEMEYQWCKLSLEWTGKLQPDRKTPIVVKARLAQQTGGATYDPRGNKRIFFPRGKDPGIEITIQGSKEELLNAMIPHHVLRSVIITFVGGYPNAWVLEGMGMMAEDERNQQIYYTQSYEEIIQSKNTLPVSLTMFELLGWGTEIKNSILQYNYEYKFEGKELLPQKHRRAFSLQAHSMIKYLEGRGSRITLGGSSFPLRGKRSLTAFAFNAFRDKQLTYQAWMRIFGGKPYLFGSVSIFGVQSKIFENPRYSPGNAVDFFNQEWYSWVERNKPSG